MNWGNLRFIPLFLLLGVVTLLQYVAAGTVRADAPGETDFRGIMNDDSGNNSCGNVSSTGNALSGTEGSDSLSGSEDDFSDSGNDAGNDSGGCGGCGECW